MSENSWPSSPADAHDAEVRQAERSLPSRHCSPSHPRLARPGGLVASSLRPAARAARPYPVHARRVADLLRPSRYALMVLPVRPRWPAFVGLLVEPPGQGLALSLLLLLPLAVTLNRLPRRAGWWACRRGSAAARRRAGGPPGPATRPAAPTSGTSSAAGSPDAGPLPSRVQASSSHASARLSASNSEPPWSGAWFAGAAPGPRRKTETATNSPIGPRSALLTPRCGTRRSMAISWPPIASLLRGTDRARERISAPCVGAQERSRALRGGGGQRAFGVVDGPA